MFLFRQSFPSHMRRTLTRGLQHPRITVSSCQSRCFGTNKDDKTSPTFESPTDPARDLLSGKVKLSQMTTRDLKAVLDFRDIRYDPEEDESSLRNRVVDQVVTLAQMEATLTPQGREYQTSRRAELQNYLPRRALALAPSLTGYQTQEVLIFVPLWDFECAAESAMNDPSDWATHAPWAHAAIATYFEKERKLSEEQPLEAISKVGDATLALFFDESDKVRIVSECEIQQDNNERQANQVFHKVTYMYDSPVPDGWTHTPPSELPQEIREKILAAIEEVRQDYNNY